MQGWLAWRQKEGKDIVRKSIIAAGILAIAAPAAAQEPSLEFVFEEVVTLGEGVSPGATARGGRNIIPITGGTFKGAINGEVLPGGWDWQLRRDDGCTDVVADYFLKTDDGVIINVRNTGVICPDQVVRTHPVFEAPLGKYDWLGKGTFVGTLERADPALGRAITIRFYRVR